MSHPMHIFFFFCSGLQICIYTSNIKLISLRSPRFFVSPLWAMNYKLSLYYITLCCKGISAFPNTQIPKHFGTLNFMSKGPEFAFQNLRFEFWEKVEVYFLWHGFECKFNQRGLSFERSSRSKLCERTLKFEFCGMSIFWALISHLNSIGAPNAYMVIGPILQNFGVKHQAFITHDYSRNFL